MTGIYRPSIDRRVISGPRQNPRLPEISLIFQAPATTILRSSPIPCIRNFRVNPARQPDCCGGLMLKAGLQLMDIRSWDCFFKFSPPSACLPGQPPRYPQIFMVLTGI